jgi:hypothetical protein
MGHIKPLVAIGSAPSGQVDSQGIALGWIISALQAGAGAGENR